LLSSGVFGNFIKMRLSSARVTWIEKRGNGMPRHKSLPNFASYEQASEWLDTHSTADLYAKPVKFTVSPALQVVIVDSQDNPVERISLKKQMSRQIRQIAKRDGISPQRLVEAWLRQKIQEQLRLSD
jgi:hypothetical protein